MKIIWLCNYSLYYLKDRLDIDIDASFFHPATWLYCLENELKHHRDIQLNIITIASMIRRNYVIKDGNVTYYLFPSSKFRILSRVGIHLQNTYLQKSIIRLIHSIQPDIITAHGTETINGLLLNRVSDTYPSILWMQGVINHVVQYENTLFMRNKLKDENKVLRKQKYYITLPSNMEEVILQNNPHAQFYHIYYPVSNYAFKLKKACVQQDSDIVFVGGLFKRKGIEDLIEMTRLLVKTNPHIFVKLIGRSDPIYLQYLKNKIVEYKIEKNINLIGVIPNHDDVLKEVKKSKIFILPTYVDSGPRSVAESMAIGTPVISYAVDGLPVMINNGVSGILVERGNIPHLAESARLLLVNEKKRDDLAREAYLFAHNNFYAPSIVPKLIDVYHQVISEARRDLKIS